MKNFLSLTILNTLILALIFINSINVKATPNNKGIIELDYDNVGDSLIGFANVKKDGKYGLIDMMGNEVIPPMYEYMDSIRFSDDFIRVKKDGKYGLINIKNEIVIPFEYEDILNRWSYNENGGVVGAKLNGKWGFIDLNNNELIPYIYDEISEPEGGIYVNNTAWAKKDTKWGLLNIDKLPIQLDQIGKNGYPERTTIESSEAYKTFIYDDISIKYRTYGSERFDIAIKIDPSMEPYYNPRFLSGLLPDENGEINYSIPQVGKGLAKQNDKWKFVGGGGNKKETYLEDIFEAKYDEPNPNYYFFSEGLIALKKNGKYGYVNGADIEVIPFIYDDAKRFKLANRLDDRDNIESFECLASVKKDNKYGYIDLEGKEKIPFIYDDARDFCDGLASVQKNGKYGYIDKDGKEVIPLIYDFAYNSFGSNILAVESNGKLGFIDANNNQITEFIYDSKKDDYISKIDYDSLDTKLKRRFDYLNEITFNRDSLILKKDKIVISKDGKYGCLDGNGKEIIPFIFETSFEFNADGLSTTKLDGKWIIISKTSSISQLSDISEATDKVPDNEEAENQTNVDTYENQYIYNETENINLLTLINISNNEDTTNILTETIASLTDEQKQSPSIIDNVTLLAEETISKTASKEVSGDIVIDYNAIEDMQAIALNTKTDIEKIFTQNGVSLYRDINTGIEFVSKSQDKINIKFDKSVGRTKAGSTDIDNIKVSTDFAQISLNTNDIYDNIDLTLEKGDNNKVKISFNTDRTTKIKVSLPSIDGNINYMAVIDESGKAIGGKYNPCNDTLEAKIASSGIYNVLYNEKDFTDIKDKAQAMQEAIKTLASKGIINGTSQVEFSPDSSISRAEVAALIVGILAKLEPNEDGGFIDVNKSNWYFGVAGSSKKYGIISGFPDNTFRADEIIPKEQIISVCARTLKTEMKYKPVADVTNYLNYADKDYISDWAKEDIALATMMDIVLKRTDNKFIPSDKMTRGDAAVVLKRLFDKIW